MKQRIESMVKYFIVFFVLVLPFGANAQSKVQEGLQGSGIQSFFGFGGLTASGSATELITNVVRLMLMLAGAIAVVFVIIGGYYYMTSAGNEEAAEQGKKTLINAIIGVVVIILSYTIINVISNQVSCQSVFGC
jgi:hypothetical protein